MTNVFGLGILGLLCCCVLVGTASAEWRSSLDALMDDGGYSSAGKRSKVEVSPNAMPRKRQATKMSDPTKEFFGKSGGDEYRIGPNDLLRVEVFQVESLSGKERVNARGEITLPLIGLVLVGGLTQAEAEKEIADRFGKDLLNNPQVNVFIEEFTSQRVTVMGQVDEPGVYPLTGATTLLQAIALAGGFDRLADTSEVVVFRSTSPGEVTGYVVDVEKVESGEMMDPFVMNDDKVVVPKSGSRELIENISGTLRGFVRFVTF